MITESLKAAAEAWSQIPRFKEIFGIAYRYGFADFLKLVRLRQLSELHTRRLGEAERLIQQRPAAERFRLALEELGPTYVKFGQILSSRRDLVNEEFYNELRKLQDHVPPFPGSAAKEIITEELGREPGVIFKEFDETPLAGASIAQVHRAVLHNGNPVAVKVRRPHIRRKIETDLHILAELAKFLEKHVESIAVLNPVGIVKDFSKTLLRELDFKNEARNMQRFAAEFAGDPRLRVPHCYEEFSTDAVLTMEFVRGERADQPERLRELGIDTTRLAANMSELIFMQVLEHGFFHGDPHPGNLSILPDGVVALYDYGMMGTFTPTLRELVADLVLGLTDCDARRTMHALLGMSESGFADDPARMQADIEAFNENHLNKPLKDINIGYVFNRLLDLLMTHRLRLQAVFYLGIKALSQIEAVGLTLNPDLNFMALAKPFAVRMFQRKLSYAALRQLFSRALLDFARIAERLPADARELYLRLRAGKFNIPIEHRVHPDGFEPLRKTLHQVANRLAQAILSAALLMSAGLIIVAKVPPLILDVPLLGWLGLLLGLGLAVRLAVKIWRDGDDG
ncbi:MAG: AarF/ABC1/UbiB kinase family protein [Verrucomicrobiales bacterium]|jgi:ubiquinone biosynthesis protein|nr:AarF/ABC1/UbiB kinase family protein [Verrucomicrobiales bacterium]